METETQRSQKETAANTETCPSCHAALVDGMRFCRMCGYRLGEGMAEYVETVRFDAMPGMPGTMGQGNQSMTSAPTTLMTPAMAPLAPTWKPKRGKKRWVAFLLLMVVLIPLLGIGGSFLFETIRDAARESVSRFQPQPDQPRSFFGAEEFNDVDEAGSGALLEQAVPGSPAERAGLLDGDVITKFDGTPIPGEDAMREALRQTPIGKTVEVNYLRDGEPKTAMLTTISSSDWNGDAFMPKERGLLGVDDLERVPVEGTKIHGVLLGDVYDNRPADLAGLKEGDIVVEFDGKPVRTREGLFGYINLAKPGSTINIVLYREGQKIAIPVKMGRRN